MPFAPTASLLLLVLTCTARTAAAMQLPPPTPTFPGDASTATFTPLALHASQSRSLSPVSPPPPPPSFTQNQLITTSIPLYAVCNPDFSECTTKYTETQYHWCSRTLGWPYSCGEGNSRGCIVTDCDQFVTFSTRLGEVSTVTGGSVKTTYYAAPYMEYIHPHPTPHPQPIHVRECFPGTPESGLESCIDKEELWDETRDVFAGQVWEDMLRDSSDQNPHKHDSTLRGDEELTMLPVTQHTYCPEPTTITWAGVDGKEATYEVVPVAPTTVTRVTGLEMRRMHVGRHRRVTVTATTTTTLVVVGTITVTETERAVETRWLIDEKNCYHDSHKTIHIPHQPRPHPHPQYHPQRYHAPHHRPAHLPANPHPHKGPHNPHKCHHCQHPSPPPPVMEPVPIPIVSVESCSTTTTPSAPVTIHLTEVTLWSTASPAPVVELVQQWEHSENVEAPVPTSLAPVVQLETPQHPPAPASDPPPTEQPSPAPRQETPGEATVAMVEVPVTIETQYPHLPSPTPHPYVYEQPKPKPKPLYRDDVDYTPDEELEYGDEDYQVYGYEDMDYEDDDFSPRIPGSLECNGHNCPEHDYTKAKDGKKGRKEQKEEEEEDWYDGFEDMMADMGMDMSIDVPVDFDVDFDMNMGIDMDSEIEKKMEAKAKANRGMDMNTIEDFSTPWIRKRGSFRYRNRQKPNMREKIETGKLGKDPSA